MHLKFIELSNKPTRWKVWNHIDVRLHGAAPLLQMKGENTLREITGLFNSIQCGHPLWMTEANGTPLLLVKCLHV